MIQPTVIFVTAPVDIRSESNLRQHHMVRHRRTKAQHEAVQWSLRGVKPPQDASRIVVTITRVGARKLDDDNLVGGCKFVRDAIARWIGIDDGNRIYQWVYNQRAQRGERKVEITITWEAGDAGG